MPLTSEEQAALDERFEALEDRNERLERLLRSGRAFTTNPLALVTDLDDLGSVKTHLDFEEPPLTPGDPQPEVLRVYARELSTETELVSRDSAGLVKPLSHVHVIKTAAEGVVNNTLQDDNELFFAIGANENWVVEFFIHWQAHTSGDIKFTIAAPSGAAGNFALAAIAGTSNDNPVYYGNNSFGGTIAIQADVTAAGRGTHLFAYVANGSTAGNVQLQWAQNTTFAGTSSSVRAFSWLRGTRVG
ncbi:hypothetical protein LCGC14_1947250 [marine sediment metagenome]|uniref:Uncharacterized protein n=1 Tax=marine sediment metagenome TaxID=412755 RepID=A0A0F9IFJ9_9ZZZZ